MTGNYNINSDLFFDIDDDSLRGHEKMAQEKVYIVCQKTRIL